MNRISRFAVCVVPFFMSLTAAAAASKKTKRTERRSFNAGPLGAVGMVDVYLFKDRNISQRCTATHIGDGLMVTAGHCFMGAYECNNARVSWENEDYTSRCQYILYSNASESYSNGNEVSNDLTVFKIDRYPQSAATLQPANKPPANPDGNLSTNAIAFSKRPAGNSSATVVSAPCQLVLGPVTNIFSQPKASDTAKHNCDLAEIASGSPLMRASSNEIVAIHQGTSLLPDPDGRMWAADSQKIHYAKIVTGADIRRIIDLPYALPDNIRIGGFAGEVFSTGIAEPLNFTVAYLQAKTGSSTVSFGVHNGLDTVIEATDGDGKKMIFGGPRRAGYDQRFRMKAPVKLTMTSAQGGLAPLAWIENIQSP